MANENPKSALDAVLEDEKQAKGGVRIYPITLGRYALLELVNSPLVVKDIPFTAFNLVPTFYIMTREVNELRGYNSKNIDKLLDQAIEWAETQTMDEGADILNELLQKFDLVNRVRPDVEEDAKKNLQPTDGSQA